MAESVEFQDPGEGIHDGEVVEVLVSEGDEVKEGQDLLVVETDKANFDVSSPVSGVVAEVRVRVGDTVEVGQTILTVDGAGARESAADDGEEPERASETDGEGRGAEKEASETDGEGRGAEKEASETDGEKRGAEKEGRESEKEADDEKREAGKEGREAGDEESGEAHESEARRPRRPEPKRRERPEGPVRASPATRRIARELGVELHAVRGSGEEGRVLASDVRAHAAETSRSAARGALGAAHAPELPDFSRFGPVERSPLRSVRRTIARRMAQAWSSIPQVTHGDVADVTDLDVFRREASERLESPHDRLSYTVLAMKAAAAALREYPRFNASLDPEAEELVYKRYYHVGVAIDTERGLLVPTVRDVERKSLRDLARELAELSKRARAGGLERDEMAGASFTITNVGGLGGTYLTPLVNPPQVAILGLARARLEPRVEGRPDSPRVTARLMLPLCLTFDHRVNDGADAARFTNRLIEILADPESFALTV